MLAESDAKRDASQRFALISDQLYLANRMGKSVCFLLLGGDRSLHEGAALEAAQQLQDNGIVMLAEYQEIGNVSPAQLEIVAAQERLQDTVTPMAISARQVVAGDLHQVPLRILLESAGHAQTEASEVLQLSVALHLPSDMAPELTNAIVRIQKKSAILQGLLRDACLSQVGLIDEAAVARIKESTAAFERDMNMLIDGDPSAGVPPAPNVSIRVTLQKMLKLWDRLTPVLEAAVNGERIETKALQKASIFGDLIEKSLVKTLGYYWAL